MIASELIEFLSKNPTAKITTIAVNMKDDGERFTYDPCTVYVEPDDIECIYDSDQVQIHIGRW